MPTEKRFKIENLDITGERFDDTKASKLANFKQLINIRAANNNVNLSMFRRPMSYFVASFAKMPKLERLDLSFNELNSIEIKDGDFGRLQVRPLLKYKKNGRNRSSTFPHFRVVFYL